MTKTSNFVRFLALTLTIGCSATSSFASNDIIEDNNSPSKVRGIYSCAVDGAYNFLDASKNTAYTIASLAYDVGSISIGVFKGTSAAINAYNSLVAEDEKAANNARNQAYQDFKEAKDDICKGISNIPTTLNHAYKATTSLGYGLYDFSIVGIHGVKAVGSGINSSWNYLSKWWQGEPKVDNSKALVLYNPEFPARQLSNS